MNSNLGIPKKLAMINDLTGYGRCSLAVAIPIVSTMGVQACPAPTSIFSNHMAFSTFHSTDYTEKLPEYLHAWEALDVSFDGIFCGFLGNCTQVDTICRFLDDQTLKNYPMILVDPVMGDHGRLYSSVSSDYVAAIRKLICKAHILTPNLTEACLLTGNAYPDSFPDDAFIPSGTFYEFLKEMAEELHRFGPGKVVITGLQKEDRFYNFVSTPDGTELISSMAGGPSRPGTGDIFASILSADALKDVPFTESVKKAAEFVRICTEGSAALNIPIKEGVCFENYLSLLTQL